MTALSVRNWSILGAVTATGVAIVPAQIDAAGKSKPSAAVTKSGAQKSKLKTARDLGLPDYRRWKSANPQPLWIPERSAALCAAPSLQNQRPSSPHEGKFIRVYVNRIARDAMLQQKTPRFGRGSIIVKEKLTSAKSDAAELLTVMVKREPGFDAANGDWEYLVANGSGTKIEQGGKLSNCQACHAPQKETDYVFRSYLPDEVQCALR